MFTKRNLLTFIYMKNSLEFKILVLSKFLQEILRSSAQRVALWTVIWLRWLKIIFSGFSELKTKLKDSIKLRP